MALFKFNLGDNSQDSSLLNGHSLQRTGYFPKNGSVHDGEIFSDAAHTLPEFLSNITSASTDPIRIVDDTDDGLTKKVRIYIKNTVGDFDEETIVWKSFIINGNSDTFNFFAPTAISGTLGTTKLEPLTVTNGRNYVVENGQFMRLGNAGSGSEVSVENTSPTETLVLDTSRDGNFIGHFVIEPGDTATFQYRRTFWIYADTDLVNDPSIEMVNTEISLLGVTTADVLVAASEVYSFSLSNIT